MSGGWGKTLNYLLITPVIYQSRSKSTRDEGSILFRLTETAWRDEKKLTPEQHQKVTLFLMEPDEVNTNRYESFIQAAGIMKKGSKTEVSRIPPWLMSLTSPSQIDRELAAVFLHYAAAKNTSGETSGRIRDTFWPFVIAPELAMRSGLSSIATGSATALRLQERRGRAADVGVEAAGVGGEGLVSVGPVPEAGASSSSAVDLEPEQKSVPFLPRPGNERDQAILSLMNEIDQGANKPYSSGPVVIGTGSDNVVVYRAKHFADSDLKGRYALRVEPIRVEKKDGQEIPNPGWIYNGRLFIFLNTRVEIFRSKRTDDLALMAPAYRMGRIVQNDKQSPKLDVVTVHDFWPNSLNRILRKVSSRRQFKKLVERLFEDVIKRKLRYLNMHPKLSIQHGDLKADNLLAYKIGTDEDGDSIWAFGFIDFGISALYMYKGDEFGKDRKDKPNPPPRVLFRASDYKFNTRDWMDPYLDAAYLQWTVRYTALSNRALWRPSVAGEDMRLDEFSLWFANMNMIDDPANPGSCFVPPDVYLREFNERGVANGGWVFADNDVLVSIEAADHFNRGRISYRDMNWALALAFATKNPEAAGVQAFASYGLGSSQWTEQLSKLKYMDKKLDGPRVWQKFKEQEKRWGPME